MQIYIFASETHRAISALTSDQTGSNLPPIYAPWRPVNSGRALPARPPSDLVTEAVKRDGFFLLSGKTVRGAP